LRRIRAVSGPRLNKLIPNVSYGDILLSSKLQYLIEKPKRGDLAIVYSPYEANEYRVFRVVGLPNEVVEMQCGQIYIDGVPVERVRIDDYEVKGKRSLPSVVGAYIDENQTDIRKVPQFRESMPNNISYNVIQERVCDTISNMVSTNIPIDAYFLLSDNRDIGRDSRATNPGLLERKNILSHIYARIWPPGASLILKRRRTCLVNTRHASTLESGL
jgi:signal peptidase I